ncbi:MAG: T9SS type A sorting domain-containing protein [Rhodothermales bacterium]|nr:T9SS type A sorting domain-containing protein [Rhodothermales bacterium]
MSTVAVKPVHEVISGTYALEQNYPNPLNPSTTIEFAIDQTQVVKLAVFDILGREVSSLVNESIPAGTYEVNFDASGLPSGVYLYRLNLSNSVATRMMTLTK